MASVAPLDRRALPRSPGRSRKVRPANDACWSAGSSRECRARRGSAHRCRSCEARPRLPAASPSEVGRSRQRPGRRRMQGDDDAGAFAPRSSASNSAAVPTARLPRQARPRTGRGCACAPAPAASTSSAPWTSASCSSPDGLVAEDLRLPLDAAIRLERRRGRALDHVVLLQPVGDQVADGADLETVRPREIHEVVEARHAAVVAHDLADDARWG